MRLRKLVLVAGVVLASGSAAWAVKPGAPLANLDTGRAVTKVTGCHADVRVQFLPEFGANVAHRHQGNNCATVLAGGGGGGGDCHKDVRRHFVPGQGKVWHRHGPACGVQLYPAQGGPAPGIGGCIQIGPSVICGHTP